MEKSLELLQEDHVRSALSADRGCDAQLISWGLENLTNKGENYGSTVKSIKLKFIMAGSYQKTSYVVKLSPCNEKELEFELTNYEFIRESGFYLELVPKLNSVLNKIGLEALKVPRCLFAKTEKGKELMILEDLRERKFQMCDRKTCMDESHAHLVLQELARLHAAFLLLQNETPDIDLMDKYPLILREDVRFRPLYEDYLSMYVKTAYKVLQETGGYEEAEEWVKQNKGHAADIMHTQLKGNPPFDVVCHGDCWTCNCLFRYNNNSQPIEVILLDFQDLRKSSLATDLNEFLYMSVDGGTRKEHLNSFLTTYHNSFKSVMDASGEVMPFSLQGLQEEYKKKLIVGFLSGLTAVPWLVGGDEGLQWYEGPADDLVLKEAFLDDLKSKTVQLLDSDPALHRRYFSMFEDVTEAGVLNRGFFC